MIDQKISHNCTGCFACQNICALDAISLVPDHEGFWYPRVAQDKCVRCGKCVTHCPSLKKLEFGNYTQPKVYAAWNTDQQIRMESTSGGVFTALAEAVLQNGGYVVGACYDESLSIHHRIISSREEIVSLRQSKYAQSRIDDVLTQVKQLLQQQKMVLFCGTPCQSAGLQQFLGKVYPNLYCCDFICRGVISPKVYQKFLEDMCPDRNTGVDKVHFKNKDFGWNRFSTKLTFHDGSVYQKDRNEDYYMRGYLRHNLYLRPSCHQCEYKSLPRVSDISLGDFWGIGSYDPSLDNEMGTSVVLVNSQKGVVLLELASKDLFLNRRTLDEVRRGNSCLLNAAPPGVFRDYFFRNMDRCRFDRLIRKIDRRSVHGTPGDWLVRKLRTIKRRLCRKR